jgi:hypothetical protein
MIWSICLVVYIGNLHKQNSIKKTKSISSKKDSENDVEQHEVNTTLFIQYLMKSTFETIWLFFLRPVRLVELLILYARVQFYKIRASDYRLISKIPSQCKKWVGKQILLRISDIRNRFRCVCFLQFDWLIFLPSCRF